VAAYLRQGWSPLQIAGRLRRMHPDDAARRVCHETIYRALYALPRGALRRELLACLRQGRQHRRPRSRGADRRNRIAEELRIAARPDEVAERLVAGHWEGDLLKGAFNRSAVGTLVERTSRLVLIARPHGERVEPRGLGRARRAARLRALVRAGAAGPAQDPDL